MSNGRRFTRELNSPVNTGGMDSTLGGQGKRSDQFGVVRRPLGSDINTWSPTQSGPKIGTKFPHFNK